MPGQHHMLPKPDTGSPPFPYPTSLSYSAFLTPSRSGQGYSDQSLPSNRLFPPQTRMPSAIQLLYSLSESPQFFKTAPVPCYFDLLYGPTLIYNPQKLLFSLVSGSTRHWSRFILIVAMMKVTLSPPLALLPILNRYLSCRTFNFDLIPNV